MRERLAPAYFTAMAETALAHLPDGALLARTWKEPYTSHCAAEYIVEGRREVVRVPYDWGIEFPDAKRGAQFAGLLPIKRKVRKNG